MTQKVDKEAVGRRIQNLRFKKGLTLEEFGKLIGDVDKSNVSKWEKGSSLPNKKRLKKISEVGGISINQLLYGDTLGFVNARIYDYFPSEFSAMKYYLDLEQIVEI